MKYRVVQFTPNPDTQAFDEVAAMLTASLRDLGHDCDFTQNLPANDRLNIFLACNLLRPSAAIFRYDYIVYQFEQLFEGSPWWKLGNLQPILQHAKGVWDYSVSNIQFLRQHGIEAAHVPLGYHKTLERITPALEKEHGVLFYGSINPRREAILNSIANLPGSPVVNRMFRVFSHQRDREIARARINLNIHFYDAMIFEAVRVSYLLNNGLLTVSETSRDYPWDGVDLPMTDADGIAPLCNQFLQDPVLAADTARRCGEQFRELYPMTRFVEDALSGAAVQASHAA